MQQQVICGAIQDQRVLSFLYDGSHRLVEPHLLGVDSDGDVTLSAWQISGGSGQGWRDFHVAKLTSLSITEQSFAGPRDGYNPNDETIDQVICRL